MRVAIFAVLISVAGFARAFDGQPVRYEVDWGPLTLADIEIRWLDSDAVRSVEADVSSRGVGAWFGSFQSALEILDVSGQGVLLNGRSTWDEGMSQLTVNWAGAESEPTVDYFRSKPRDYEISPIPEQSTVGTVHPFAPVFEVAGQLDETGRCEGDYAVFDGIRRYNVRIEDGGDVMLSDEGGSGYQGEAHVCRISVERIGGFSTGRRWFNTEESEVSRVLYFGRLGAHWLPVRFEISAPIGSAVARWVPTEPALAELD